MKTKYCRPPDDLKRCQSRQCNPNCRIHDPVHFVSPCLLKGEAVSAPTSILTSVFKDGPAIVYPVRTDCRSPKPGAILLARTTSVVCPAIDTRRRLDRCPRASSSKNRIAMSLDSRGPIDWKTNWGFQQGSRLSLADGGMPLTVCPGCGTESRPARKSDRIAFKSLR
jgi:hypothetical protein